MRGAGKSFLGEKLAQDFHVPFIDLDTLIQDKEGISITEMVEKNSWEYFRAKESQYLKEALSSDQLCVIATGGGAVLSPQNREIMEKNGVVIWVYAPLQLIFQRLQDSSSLHRPALTSQSFEEELKSIYKEREPIYKQMAHFIFHSVGDYQEQLQKIQKSINCDQ